MAKSSFDINTYIPSYSFLKNLEETTGGNPKKALYKKMNPTPSTVAQTFGTLVDVALFHPEKLESDYFVFDPEKRPRPDQNFTAKVNKKWKTEVMGKNEGKALITQSQMDAARTIQDSIFNDPYWGMFTEGRKKKEVRVYTDPKTGLKYRGECDLSGMAGVLEVKTTKNAGSKKFRYDAISFYYDAQLPAYMIGEGDEHGHADGHYLIIENVAPYCHRFMPISNDDFEKGISLFRKWLTAFYDIKKRGLWGQGFQYWDNITGMRETNFNRFTSED